MSEGPRDVHSLANNVVLRTVRTVELCAKLDGDPGVRSGELPAPTYELEIQQHSEEPEFRVTVTMVFELPPGDMRVGAMAEYAVPGWLPQDLTEDLILEFTNRSVLMTLAPYLRHDAADLGLRVLGVRPLMPVFRPGDLVFSTNMAVGADDGEAAPSQE